MTPPDDLRKLVQTAARVAYQLGAVRGYHLCADRFKEVRERAIRFNPVSTGELENWLTVDWEIIQQHAEDHVTRYDA